MIVTNITKYFKTYKIYINSIDICIKSINFVRKMELSLSSYIHK